MKEFIGKDFDVELIHKNTYKATRTRSNSDEIKIDLYDEGLVPEQALCLTHLLMLVDYVYEVLILFIILKNV